MLIVLVILTPLRLEDKGPSRLRMSDPPPPPPPCTFSMLVYVTDNIVSYNRQGPKRDGNEITLALQGQVLLYLKPATKLR